MLQVLPNQRDLIRLDGYGITQNNSLNTARFRHPEDVNGSRQIERHHVVGYVVNMFLRSLSEGWHASRKDGRNCKRERQTKTVIHDIAFLVTINLARSNLASAWKTCQPLDCSGSGSFIG